MALRIAKIDYETKTITLNESVDNTVGDGTYLDLGEVPDEPSLTLLGLREGMVFEGDGIDEYGMFINPRRVR